MENSKEHSLFRLIKSMDGPEKAYFKKYAFKRENKNNDSFKKLFDLIEKQSSFDINKISESKQISASLKKNLHATLNSLYKIVVNVLVEYRKDKFSTYKLFQMIAEYDMLREKNLIDLAKKKLKQLEVFAEAKNKYFFKPYIYQIQGTILQNNIIVDSHLLEEYISNLDRSKLELEINIDTRKFGLRLESFFHRNGGIVIKNQEKQEELDLLLIDAQNLVKLCENNFLFYSVAVNNRFIVQMISGKLENLKDYINDFLIVFDEKIHTIKSDFGLGDILISIKNFAVVSMYFGMETFYEKLFTRLQQLKDQLNSDESKERLDYRLLHLEISNYAINNTLPISNTTLEKAIKIIEDLDKNKAQYPELLLSLMMALFRFGKLDEILDLSERFIKEKHNDRTRDGYISIRLVRAITFFKKDEYDLFQSEIQSMYRKLLATENFPLQLTLTQMLKKMNKISLKSENKETLQKILIACDAVMQNGTGAEMMKASELRAIANLPFQ